MWDKTITRKLAIVGAGLTLLGAATGCARNSRQPSGDILENATIERVAMRSNIAESEMLISSTKQQNIYLIPAGQWVEWLRAFPEKHPNERIVDSSTGGTVKRGEGIGDNYSSYSVPSAIVVITDKL